jgi:hypothetical protein
MTSSPRPARKSKFPDELAWAGSVVRCTLSKPHDGSGNLSRAAMPANPESMEGNVESQIGSRTIVLERSCRHGWRIHVHGLLHSAFCASAV